MSRSPEVLAIKNQELESKIGCPCPAPHHQHVQHGIISPGVHPPAVGTMREWHRNTT